jgi:hypothetical protein
MLCLLTAVATQGCGGSSSSSSPPPPPPPPPDTSAPTVGPIDAGDGAALNRTATLTVTATDNVGVTEVRFFADDNLVGTDTSAPYSVEWDTGAVTDGDHVLRAEAEDAAGNVGESAELTVTVQNTFQFALTLSGEQEVPAVESAGTASADLAVNIATGEVTGTLTINGIDVVAAHIHDGFAGENGPVVIGLEQDAGDPSIYDLPAGAMLDATGVDKLLAAGLYLNAHTAANPGGELRAQILPPDFALVFASLSGDNEVPRVDTVAGGRAAVTLNTASGALVVQARVNGLDGAVAAHVHDAFAGENGPVLVGLTQDGTDPGRWFVEDGLLNEAGIDGFLAGGLYVNVHSPANPGGEVRGQIIPDGIDLLVTELSGEQEVPAVDSAASGTAFLTHDTVGGLLTINVSTRNLPDASGAHLHRAYGGLNGGVDIGLTQDGSDPSRWFIEAHPLSEAQADALAAGASYVNVHTPTNPGGEIRGQVIPDGILFATGRLEGRQEVPVVDTAAGGTFAVTVDPATSMLQAHANTTGVDDAVAAHLHQAYAGVSGPVSVGLTQDANDVTRWSATDVMLTADQLDAFRSGRLYVNVHTPANPAGEIRGQVAPPPIEVLFTTLSGEQEVPAVTTAASGLAAMTTNRETGTVTLHLRATGADDAVASHIHGAFAGFNGSVIIGLTQDPADVTHWFVEDAQFDAAGLADYLDGRTYVNLHTPANPGGEIRGQVVPEDIVVLFSPMDGDQVVPPVVTSAAGLTATTANLATRRFVVVVNASGVDDATSAGLHQASAGNNGPEVLPLVQTAENPGQWSAETEPLQADAWSAYRGGSVYTQVATPAAPGGEIRGQVVPTDAGDFDGEAPTVQITAPAAGDVSGTVTIEATAADNIGVTEVRFLADGELIGTDATAPYTADWDTTAVSNGDVSLTAEAVDASGNTGTSVAVVVTVANAAPVTLSQIQAEVFTPSCAVSGCHDGGGSGLPRGMDLTAGNSHGSLVNVMSVQVNFDRVEPGDPDASYLIDKLEGTQAGGTSRMPLGGSALDQATINRVRQWITEGALDN